MRRRTSGDGSITPAGGIRRRRRRLGLALATAGLLGLLQLGQGQAGQGQALSAGTARAGKGSLAAAAAASPAAKRTALAAYGKLPLAFVPNAGQTDASVRYSAQAGGYSIYLTRDEAVLALIKKKQGVALG